MKRHFLILISLISNYIYTQSPQISFWNTNENPTYSLDNKSCFFIHYNNKYLLKEWNNKTIGYDYETGKGSITFGFEQQGNYKFSYNQLSTSYSKKLSPQLSMGFGINISAYQQIEIPNTLKFVSPMFGIKYLLTEVNTLWLSVSNTQSAQHINGLPNEITAMWKHKLSNQLNGFLKFTSEQNSPLLIDLIFSYQYET